MAYVVSEGTYIQGRLRVATGRLCHCLWTSICCSLSPHSANRLMKLSNLLPRLLPKLAGRWTTARPSLTSVLLSTSQHELQPLAGCQQPAVLLTRKHHPQQPPLRSRLCCNARPGAPQAIPVEQRLFGGLLIFTQQSTSTWNTGHPSPQGGWWPTWGFLADTVFPKFISLLLWLACSYLFVNSELVQGLNLKLTPAHVGQRGTEARGGPVQIGR